MSSDPPHFAMPEHDPCPFCENVSYSVTSKGTQCAVIAETERTLTFVNPDQKQRGAVLVIPRRHVPTILDLTDDDAIAVMNEVRRASSAVTRTFVPDGVNVFQNNGVAAGQSVPHCHFHVVPRYGGDGGLFGPARHRIAYKERVAIAEAIRAHWSE